MLTLPTSRRPRRVQLARRARSARGLSVWYPGAGAGTDQLPDCAPAGAAPGTWFGTGPHWAVDPERRGHVMTFNGSGNNDAGVTMAREIVLAAPFTVCAWARLASGAMWAPFLLGRSTGTAAVFYNGGLFYWVSDAGGIAWAELANSPANGEWFHVAMATAFTGSIRTYQNGVYANLNPFSIGAVTIGILGRGQYNSTWGSWTDRLDDVRIYNRALCAAEIRSIYERGRAAPLSDLAEDSSRTFSPPTPPDWNMPLAEPVRTVPPRIYAADRVDRVELFLWPTPRDGGGPDAIRVKRGPDEIRHLVAVRTLPGVVLLAVAGANGPGLGRLASSGDGTAISWRAPGSATFGEAIDCATEGTYLLADGEDRAKWVRVAVYPDHLSPTPRSVRVHLGDVYQNGVGWRDVEAAEAAAGDVEIYSLVLANDSPGSISGLVVWIDAATPGVEISDDGSTWSTPTSEGTGILFGEVPSGEARTLWIRRTIAAAAGADPEVLTLLHYAFNSL